ncbi:hypothetical protein IWC96_14500 [Brevundimonas sp. BAL450]|uniref:hypothetical protein n=1 Tax=Brevundimonas sp. BAL450 TaxID=1708162 RepID=UPI0018C9096C|nr:hypothetical protein [Brevundimonas sp. BAL450]MBG7616485.1 hypothetical protein [Brevundimonas sp. BAL450]
MPDHQTHAELFCAAGRALFGENWQQPTARLLGWKLVNGQNRAVQRIKAAADAGEEYGINPAVLAELAGHLADRATECKGLARRLATAAKPRT